MATTSVPTTPTTQALLDALTDQPGATAAELASAAGIGRSTASKLLATLAAQGHVLRQPGSYQGGRRVPDRWTLITTTNHSRAASTNRPVTSTVTATDPDRSRPGAGRLRAGELRGLVEGCLAQRPGQALLPTAIAKIINRSAGAVANALQTLAGQGRVVQAQTNPRRYRIGDASDPAATTD